MFQKSKYVAPAIMVMVVLASFSYSLSLMNCPRDSDYLSLIDLASEWFPPGTSWEVINMTRVGRCPDRFAALSDVDLPERLHLNESDVERMMSAIDGRWYSTWWRVNGSYYQSITVAGGDGTFDSLVSFFYRVEERSWRETSNHSSVRDKVIISGVKEWRILTYGGKITLMHRLRYDWEVHANHRKGSGRYFEYTVGMSVWMEYRIWPEAPGWIPPTVWFDNLAMERARLDVSVLCHGRRDVIVGLGVELDVHDARASLEDPFYRSARKSLDDNPSLLVDVFSEIVDVPVRYDERLEYYVNGSRRVERRTGTVGMEVYGRPSFEYRVFWKETGNETLVPDGSTVDGPLELVVEVINNNRESTVWVRSPGGGVQTVEGDNCMFSWYSVDETVAAGERRNITMGLVAARDFPGNISVEIVVHVEFHARGMVEGNEEYVVGWDEPVKGNAYVERQGPVLVLEYIEDTSLLRRNAWEDKPLYFEPVSVIKFGYGVIRNDGGVDAINVSVWMVFGNSTHNWTASMSSPEFNVSAGSKFREFNLDRLDLGNVHVMGGIVVPGEYFIEFHANYSYSINGILYNASVSLLVEKLMWDEDNATPLATCLPSRVEIVPLEVSFEVMEDSVVKVSLCNNGHVQLSIEIDVSPTDTWLYTEGYPRPPGLSFPWENLAEAVLGIIETAVEGEVMPGVASAIVIFALATGLDAIDSQYEQYVASYLNDLIPDNRIFHSSDILGQRYHDVIVLNGSGRWEKPYPVRIKDWQWYDRSETLRNGSFDALWELREYLCSDSIEDNGMSREELFGNGYKQAESRYVIKVIAKNATYDYVQRNSTRRDIIVSGEYPLGDLHEYQRILWLYSWYFLNSGEYLLVGLFLMGLWLASLLIGGGIVAGAIYSAAVAFITKAAESLERASTLIMEARRLRDKIKKETAEDPPYNFSRLDRLPLIDFPGIDSTMDLKLSAALASANRSLEAINALNAGDIRSAEELSRNASRFLAIALPLSLEVPPANISLDINETVIEEALSQPVFEEVGRILPGMVPSPANVSPGIYNISSNGTVIREEFPVIGGTGENETLSAMNGSAWQLYFDGNLTGAYMEAMELYRIAWGTIYGGWAMRLVSLIEERFIRGVAVNGTIYAGGRHGIKLEFDHPTDMSVDVYAVIDGERRHLGTYGFRGAGIDSVEVHVDVPLECKEMGLEIEMRSGPVELRIYRGIDVVSFDDAVEMARAGIGECPFGEYLLERAIDGDLLAGFVLRRLFPNTTLLFYMICGRSELYPVAERLDGNVYLSVLLDIYAMTGNPWIERILEEAGVI